MEDVVNERATPFESISELKAAHAQLLGALDGELQNDASPEAETSAVIRHEAGARQFIERCAATGVFLENVSDRTAATVLLEYWISTLNRAGRPTTPTRLARFDAAQLPSLEATPCPFKGLDAFRVEDREFFFGRDADTKELIEQVTNNPLTIVSGASGSGKSSLVMSGLLPALAASNSYVLLPVIRPGNAVLDHLAGVAQPGKDNPEKGVALRRDPARLATWLGGDTARPVVITIDQFEEIFTLANDDDRNALVAGLAGVLGAGRGHRIVLTIRQEFQTRVVELKALLPYLDKAWFTMRPMSYDQLRAAIDEPARRANLQFQPGIADDLAKKVLGQSAALPLLQFTLRALWENRDRNRITQEVYRRVGDPLSALKSSADHFFDSVAPETQEEIKRVLVQLVRVDDFLEAYRQPVPLAELLSAGKANTRDVLELLRKNDYLAFSAGDGDDAIVEVKHESLLRNWPRYVQWIDEKRLARRRRLTVTEAADRWARSGKDPELLLTGWQLDDARNLTDLSDKETEFVRASAEAADQRKLEQEERIRKKARRRLRQQTAATIAALGIASVVTFLWFKSTRQEETASLLAELNGARFLAETDPTAGVAAIALSLDDHVSAAENPDLLPLILRSMFSVPDQPLTQAIFSHNRAVAGLILAKSTGIVTRGQNDLRFWSFEGVERGRFPSDNAAQPEIVLAATDTGGTGIVTIWADGSGRQFDATGHVQKSWPSAGERVTAAAFSPQANRLFEVPQSGAYVRVLNGDGEEIRRLKSGSGAISKIVANPDGSRVATLQNGRISVWDVASGRSTPFPPGEMARNPTLFFSDAWFSPDGLSILALRNDGVAQLWSPGAARAGTTRLGQPVRRACFSPNGPLIATVSFDGGAVQRWLANGMIIGDPMMMSAETLACHPASNLIATTSSDRTASIWDANGRRTAWLRGHQDIVWSVELDATSQFALTVSADGSARLWNLSSRVGASLGGHGSTVVAIGFSADGQRLVTSSETMARVWKADFSLEAELRKSEESEAGPRDVAVLDAHFSPDGARVVTSYDDRTARIWNLADGSFRDLVGHGDWVAHASFSPDGQHVLTNSPDRTTRFWNLKGEPVVTLTAETKSRGQREEQLWFRSAVFSPDNQQIVTTDAEKVQLWNTAGRLIATLDFPAEDAEFSRNGQLIVARGSDGARLWNPGGRTAALPLEAPRAVATGFSADGSRVFTATQDGAIALWDVAGNRVSQFNAGPTATAELSRDGRLIVTLGTDKRIRLWDTSGRQFATIGGESTSVTLSPDGRFMALIPAPGDTARVWPISVTALEERLGHIRVPCLNLTQLREVMLDETEAQMHAERCQPGTQNGHGR